MKFILRNKEVKKLINDKYEFNIYKQEVDRNRQASMLSQSQSDDYIIK